jgi:hypothetical protein
MMQQPLTKRMLRDEDHCGRLRSSCRCMTKISNQNARASDPKVDTTFGIDPMLTFNWRTVRAGKPDRPSRTMRCEM